MGFNLDIMIECASTMRLGTGDDGSDVITFRVSDDMHSISFEGLALLLGFDLDVGEVGNVSKEELDFFWLYLFDVEERKKGHIKNHAIQGFHLWMATRTTGRIDSSNINDSDMRWLYHAIMSPTHCNPISMMVRNWFGNSSSMMGKLAFGSYIQLMIQVGGANQHQ